MLRLLVVLIAMTAASASSAAEWGTIAYSPSTGAMGYSHNWPDEVDAELTALAKCEQYADDCTTAISFRNACGAIAVGRDGGWGASWGTNRTKAEQAALRRCNQYDGGCKVRRWQCSK